jgi:hypothetical protein
VNGSQDVPMSAPLRVALLLTGLAGGYAAVVLFFFPDRSAVLFAWNIKPPLTAATMGAFYAAAIPLVFILARQLILTRQDIPWRMVRPVVLALFVLSTTMLIATAAHADRFIWSSPVAWAWLVIYLLYAPLTAVLYIQHARRSASLASPLQVPVHAWFRYSAFTVAALLGALGLGLIIAPVTFAGFWPWPLTPLTGRVMGGWLLTLCAGVVGLGRERDWTSIRLTLPATVVVLVLLAVALLRFREEIDWTRVSSWVYAGLLMGGLAIFWPVYRAYERSAADSHARGSVSR